jgi:hypothetical protein
MRYKFYITLVISAFICSAAGCVFGQNNIKDLKNASPEQRAQFQTDMMKSKLKLDPAQLLKVQDINLKYAQKFQPIIKSSDSRFSKMKQAMALQEQKDKELETIFTKNQFSEYKEFEQELKSKMRAKMSGSN